MANHPEGVRLAFDVGKVNVGVAVSDRYGILASPLVTLKRLDTGLSDAVLNICAENETRLPFTQIWFLPPNNINEIIVLNLD